MINRQRKHPSPQRRWLAHGQPGADGARPGPQRAFRSRPLEPSREHVVERPCEPRGRGSPEGRPKSTPSTCSSTCSSSWATSSWARASARSRYHVHALDRPVAPLDSCECPGRRNTRWQAEGHRDRHRGVAQPRALPAERRRSAPHSLQYRAQAFGDQQAYRQFGRRLNVDVRADAGETDGVRRDRAARRSDFTERHSVPCRLPGHQHTSERRSR